MKTLTLDLQKRILIVELPEGTIRTDIMSNVANTETILLHFYDERGCFESLPISEPGILKLICKGSELTEEIAKGLVNSLPHPFGSFRVFRDYTKEHKFPVDAYLLSSALDSFISAIEAEGWYFGENPLGKEPKITEDKYELEREVIDNNPEESIFGDHYADWSMWQEAESKTFHPHRVLISEIV